MVTLDNAIAEFFKLRGSYEKTMQARRRKIMRNPGLSKGEKLRALSAVTGACYACGRKGHMAFRETKTMLAVTCAAQRGGCDLDIKIDRGNYTPLSELLKDTKDDLEQIKSRIISIKLDLLFGYSDESETRSKFAEAKLEYEAATKKVNAVIAAYADNIENQGSAAAILSLQDRIASAQFVMKETSGEPDRAERLVRIYLDEILPAATQLRDTQFRFNAVLEEPGPDKKSVVAKKLVQIVAPYDIRLVPTRPGKVIRFVK